MSNRHCHRLNMTICAAVLAPMFITAQLLGSSVVVAQNNNDAGVMVDVEATVTGQLKTRNYLVTIYAGPEGPLYTVLDADGNVQGIKLSPSLLAARFPVLKSIIENPADDASNSANDRRPSFLP